MVVFDAVTIRYAFILAERQLCTNTCPSGFQQNPGTCQCGMYWVCLPLDCTLVYVINSNVYMHVYMHAHVRACVDTCVHVSMHECVCVCVCVVQLC